MTTASKLEFVVERDVMIRAPRGLVFRYFTDSKRFASWWGEGSTIEGRTGGAVRIVSPGGAVAIGTVLEIVPEERVVFTYGFESGKPIAAGASRVSVSLAEEADGTRVRLRHEMSDAAVRAEFVQGWRYQLAVFANVVTVEVHAAESAGRADRWFAAWNEADGDARRRAFAACAAEAVAFADVFSQTAGLDDLNAHVTAAKFHMPGITVERTGAPRQCQGAAIVDWAARGPDGRAAGSGTNLFEFTPDGRIARVVGFWGGSAGT
jgi:uncharacterized protein YndB with AHSA1/START domain